MSLESESERTLTDWDLFRLATLLDLVGELEKQAASRHPSQDSNNVKVAEAMARQLRRGSDQAMQTRWKPFEGANVEMGGAWGDGGSGYHADERAFGSIRGEHNPTDFQSDFDSMNPFPLVNTNAMPFIPEWDFRSLLPDIMPWDTSAAGPSSGQNFF